MQRLIVFGEEMHCRQPRCKELATVMIAQSYKDPNGEVTEGGVLLCDNCWREMMRRYRPEDEETADKLLKQVGY